MFALKFLVQVIVLIPVVHCGYKHKRGLAMAPTGHPEDIQLAANAAPSWVYNWSPWPLSVPQGIEFVAMQWGRDNIQDLQRMVRSNNVKTVLGFNEPDWPDQSNIDPVTAASLWKQYINPLAASGIKLGSPAPTSAPEGRHWLTAFLNACNGCTIDFIAFHWYGEGAQNFINYVQSMHDTFPNRQLCVTEFSDTGRNPAVIDDFLSIVLPFLDSASYIRCYAFFDYSRDANSLRSNMITNGALNTIGTHYVHH